jgi:adenylate cyclase
MGTPTTKWNLEEITLVRECLALMLKSDLFILSERQSRFLQYIVEKTLEGEGKKLKQYSIGIDVFDRDVAFDPTIDSIVRVEAGRLRAKLREYYSSLGSEDPVWIELSKGKYAVDFQFRQDIKVNAVSAPSSIEDKPLIAVLAFINSSGDPEQEYFADGISEDIITDLSKFPGLAVIARHSSFSFKNKAADTQEIARQLGADYILEGSVRKAGSRVRISAQLVDASVVRQLWAERYDHELDDIFAVQDDVTKKIVAALQLTLGGDEKTGLRQKTPTNLEAYDCVLRGAEYSRHSDREDLVQAQALFRRAISLDPEYAEAYARLSRLYVYKWISGLDQSGQFNLQEAKELASRAVELCPNLALAHASLGWVYEWLHENDKAMAEWGRAIELDPSQADALNWLSLNLAWAGQTQEANEKIECARRLNPLEKYYFPRGMISYMDGNHNEAISLFEKLIVQDPAFLPGHLFLASSYGIMGLQEQGQATVKKILLINPDYKIFKASKGSITVPEISKRFRQSLVQLGLPLAD